MLRKYLKNVYYFFLGKYNSKYLINEYGKKYKTDKINQHHTFAGKNYLDIYDLYFKELKNKSITMLEIGVREGSSLRTFRDYFRKGKIIGLDINPETHFKENRIETFIGSQSSPEIIQHIFNMYPTINIVLDDGSHVNELTIASYKLLFNKLPSGSIYIIEDLACTYLEEQLENDIIVGGWPGMNYNDSSVEMINKRSDMDTFFNSIIKEMDFKNGDVEFIHFWAQLCIIKKK